MVGQAPRDGWLGRKHGGSEDHGEANSGKYAIGKFDILATYTYAKALLDGAGRRRGQGAGHGRGDHGGQGPARAPGDTHEDYKAQKEAAEKKKKTTITAESFDHQVADKMGGFFDDVFLPAMKKLVEAGLSYDEVKKLRRRSRRPGGRRSAASSSGSVPRASSRAVERAGCGRRSPPSRRTSAAACAGVLPQRGRGIRASRMGSIQRLPGIS